LAAASVLFHHAGFEIWKRAGLDNPIPIGAFGVDLFFVLSGLVMWVSTSTIRPAPARWRQFLTRRILRVVPLYWLATLALATAILLVPSSATASPLADGHLWKSLLFVPQPRWPLLIVGWTLSHELLFYLLFSLRLAWNRGIVLVVFSLLCLGTLGWLRPPDPTHPWYQLLCSPFHFEFLMGMACGELLQRQKLPHPLVSLAALIGIAAIARSVELDRWMLWGGSSTALCLVALRLEPLARRSPAWLGESGDASYSLYLLHLPVVTLVARVSHGEHRWLAFWIAVALCQALAIACWRWCDRPLQALCSRWPGKA